MKPSSLLKPILTVIAVAVASVPAMGVAAHGADTPTCDGQPATIVGTPGQNSPMDRLDGTSGDDVIVSNGVTSVYAGAGNDLVCATGLTLHVIAGDGNDTVENQTADGSLAAYLGAGSDVYHGGPGGDYVTAGSGEDGPDVDQDQITTGAGFDNVWSGDTANRSLPNNDHIDLGDGDDHLYLAGNAAGADIDGGTGVNRLSLELCCVAKPLYVDNAAGRIYSSTRPDPAKLVGSYRGTFDRFGFSFARADSFVTYSSVGFRGTARNELIFFYTRAPGSDPTTTRKVDLMLGGGNDLVEARGFELRGSVNGGPGRDEIDLASWAKKRALVALGDGITADGKLITRLLGVQDITLAAKTRAPLTVSGSSADNRITVSGAGRPITVYGNKGNDYLDATSAATAVSLSGGKGNDYLYGSKYSDHLVGGTGDDHLHGAAGNDDLYGGPGNDVLHGGSGSDILRGGSGADRDHGAGGRDRCSAEVKFSCEVQLR